MRGVRRETWISPDPTKATIMIAWWLQGISPSCSPEPSPGPDHRWRTGETGEAPTVSGRFGTRGIGPTPRASGHHGASPACSATRPPLEL